MADERFEVEFVSRVGSYQQGIQLLVRAHAQLASTFDRTSRAGDRLERDMLKLAGVQTQAAGATQRTAAAFDRASQASPRLRYALYDVAATAAVAGAALLGVATATTAVSIRFERNFADVARVTNLTGFALQGLREDFDQLYRTLPVGFADLTKIGTLAGQLDIAEASIASFTGTVAKFSATSNVSVEQSATALGRLAQLLPDVGNDYEGLADAILKVGANSVSTEAQIIAISSQLAGVATTANLSSKELIALAGTLASVGTAPELSRGAITRLFANIEQAIAGGGERLQAFATVSGRSAEQFTEDWGSDSFVVIQDLFEGIGSSGGQMGSVLRNLGITASRDIPVFQKLAQNTDILASAFDDATNSAGEVDRQYSIIASTVAEKINILVNNFNSLLDVLGRSTLGFSFLIDAAVGVLQILQRIGDNPIASTFAFITIAVGALAGVALLVVAALTRMAASSLALRLAMTDLGITSASTALSLNGMTTALFGTGAAATRATAAVGLLGKAMSAIPVLALAIIGNDLAQTFRSWYDEARGASASVSTVTDEFTKLADGQLAEKLQKMFTLDLFGNQAAGLGVYSEYKDLYDILATADSFVDPLMNTPVVALVEATRQYDEALTQLVSSGKVEEAQRLFAALAEQQAKGGVSTEQVLSVLPGYEAALDSLGLTVDSTVLSGESMVDQLADLVSEFTVVQKSAIDTQNSIDKLGQSLGENGNVFDQFSAEGRANMGALLDVINAVAAETPGDAAATAGNLQALFDTLVNGAGVSAASLDFLRQMIGALAMQGGGIGSANINFQGLFQGIATGSKKASKAAGGAAKQIRTLVDYANDLGNVLNRSFDIRFGSQSAMDTITTSWMDLNEEIAEYRRQVDSLTADRAIKSYFLSVAETFNDVLRAGVLRAEIADIDAELAKATAGASTELNGNSKAAITNRKRITDLLSSYNDYVQALAAGGADQATLNAAVAQSRNEFIQQANALGYSNQQLQPYIASFNDMATAIARVPRSITVVPNTDPALQALNELEARFRGLGGQTFAGPQITNPTNAKEVRRLALEAAIVARAAWVNELVRQRNFSGANNAELSLSQMRQNLASGNYWTGGYTGNGGKYEPKGTVHGGEFVFDKKATQNAGVGNLYAMMKSLRAGKGYSMGGYVPTAVPVSSGGGFNTDPMMHTLTRTLISAVKEIRPGWILPEDLSRISQEGDKRRRQSGDL